MKTEITATLSKNSFKSVADYLEKYRDAIKQGSENGVKRVTERTLDLVKAYCYQNGIVNHTDEIYAEYDEQTNTGKVYTNNTVIIFNELGTGVVGKNNPHPNLVWNYDRNNHGEKGWGYPKGDGTYGMTRGLPSRHMFYSTYEQIKDMLGDAISMEIYITEQDLY